MPGASVLVVDHSPTILKLVQLVLTKAGYRVEAASSGQAGLSAAREEPPALILLDHVLPDMKGDEVVLAMSGDMSLAEIPVVVMARRGEDVSQRYARLTNVVDHVAKPFSPDALLAVVAHVLEKHARTHGPGAEVTPPALDLAPVAASPATRDAAEPQLGDAALAGDLATISIADVLSVLQDQQQTGVLVLARGDERLEVWLSSGRIDYAGARGVPDEFLLGRFLVDEGVVTAAALASVIAERKAPPRTLLGADLVGRGLLTPTGLRKAMAHQTTALVHEGLRWGTGRFWFRTSDDAPVAAREATLGLAVDGLVMEGLRRVDEWRLIEREIGDFDIVFVRNDDKLAAFGPSKLLRDELAVLEYVNGKNSVKEIISSTKMGSFDVAKMLYRLFRNKLVRRRVAPVMS